MGTALDRSGRLPEAHRRVLLDLLVERPHLSIGQLRKIFTARTGRAIGPSTVSRAKARRYPSLQSGRSGRHLTESERAILERICHRAAPRYSRAATARLFAAEAGRSIGLTSVGDLLRRHSEDAPRTRRAGRGGEGVAAGPEISPT